jgi:hypothetical protein
LREVHKQTILMTRMLRDAIDLVRTSGSPEAALKVQPHTHASRVIECFTRKHPDSGAPAAIKVFEDALRDCESDQAALAPHIERYGARTIGSFAPVMQERLLLFYRIHLNVGSFVQRIREARYAARHLPALLETLRGTLPELLMQEIANAPLEEATERIKTSQIPDERARAAAELRQLRDLFASTGFGDLLTTPADFFERREAASAHVTGAAVDLAPELLDLLIDAQVLSAPALGDLKEWPTSMMRARTQNELAEIVSLGSRFDVVVADDVDEFDADTLERFAATGTWVHRLGTTVAAANTIILEVPHQQVHFEIVAAASRRPGHWLGGPGGLGVVVREASGSSYSALKSAALQLVTTLQRLGRNAALFPLARDGVADIVVAAVDELLNVAVRNLARCAREGVVILCRQDLRRAESLPDPPRLTDATTAQSLGWQIKFACREGVLLERNGKCVALVNEPVGLTGSEDVVTDIVYRLSSLGWRPLVAWQDAPRDLDQMERLLDSHAIPLVREDPLHAFIERLDLSRLDTPSQPNVGSDQRAENGPDIYSGPPKPIGAATTGDSPVPITYGDQRTGEVRHGQHMQVAEGESANIAESIVASPAHARRAPDGRERLIAEPLITGPTLVLSALGA